MSYRIAVIPGDGAGPEVVAEACKSVDALGRALEWNELDWGTTRYHREGAMMPPDALDVVRRHDAVLLGAVCDPTVPDHLTLWGLLLELRLGLDLWANLRPARLLEGVPSPLASGAAIDVLSCGRTARANTPAPEVGRIVHSTSRSSSRREFSHASGYVA